MAKILLWILVLNNVLFIWIGYKQDIDIKFEMLLPGGIILCVLALCESIEKRG